MNRSQFDTGKPHQQKVSNWVRRRLADTKGRIFAFPTRHYQEEVDQYGVILADAVGLGKTWESLAATALLLYESAKERRGGGKRQNQRRKPAKVLVLCPPGLVSKWMDELSRPHAFRRCLETWVNKQASEKRTFVKETFLRAYPIRRPNDLMGLQQQKKMRGKLNLPSGVYVCNWNVLLRGAGPGYSRRAAFPRQDWEIVIVDEAHHPQARKALTKLDHRRFNIMFLTATPFQLDPKGFHPLLGAIIDRSKHTTAHKVFNRKPLKEFVEAVKQFYGASGSEHWDENLPIGTIKRDAERHLQQVLTRNRLTSRTRQYYLVGTDGNVYHLPESLDHLKENDLRELRCHMIEARPKFQEWYLQNRLELSVRKGKARTFVATKLRQMLSTKRQAEEALRRLANGAPFAPPGAPRADALRQWADRQVKKDLEQFVQDGWPRKILVFTSFVDNARHELHRGLHQAITRASQEIQQEPKWREMAKQAPERIDRLVKVIKEKLDDLESRANDRQSSHKIRGLLREVEQWLKAVERWKSGTLRRDMFGQPHFVQLVKEYFCQGLERICHYIDEPNEDIGSDQQDWQRRLRNREIDRLRATLGNLRDQAFVGTYTGHDDQKERDATGEAFRSPIGPLALVASNVGSEGIDLQTFSAHLLHFDIEWNPAKMEQREGRLDRVGRKLPGPVNVYYLLVGKTYDERMLHQLVARQRWHGVLLGRPAGVLYREKNGSEDTPWANSATVRKLTLDLRPRDARGSP